MDTTTSLTHPWRCTKCTAVVFIPTNSGVDGGVCTQQRRGCEGEIEAMSDEEAAEARRAVVEARVPEQPWLTLIFRRGSQGAS